MITATGEVSLGSHMNFDFAGAGRQTGRSTYWPHIIMSNNGLTNGLCQQPGKSDRSASSVTSDAVLTLLVLLSLTLSRRLL